MAKAANTDDRPAGIQRGRGGFMRNAADVPYVSDPTGATVKSGPRKGEPKRLAYGSPSNFGKQIENTTNLVKWGERRVVLGIGADPDLIAMCGELLGLDVDSDEYKTLADSIIVKAKEAAQASLAAERGTHGHSITEDSDEGRDWLRRVEQGEALGLEAGVQAGLAAAWREMLERTGLEILAVEASCVDDQWRLAGTLDRIARVTRPLRFAMPGGEVREIPAGEVIVLDVKTGTKRTRKDGSILYWQGYSVQIASYAQSVPYDTVTEQRGEWPWPISQEHAVIAHLDVLAAIAGSPTCELVYVDLEAGREHGGECVVQAKAWEQRIDVFSVAQLENASDSGLQPVESDAQTPAASPVATGDAPDGSPVAAGAPSEGPGPSPAPAPRTPADEQDAVRSRPAPDDGDPVIDPTYEVLQREYMALGGEGRAWITSLTEQAIQAGVSFHSKGHRTVRRYEILRGLVLLAANSATIDDDLVRALLEGVIGHVAQFQSVPVGQLVGSLTAREAHDFADLCDRFAAGQFGLTVDDDGAAHLRAAA